MMDTEEQAYYRLMNWIEGAGIVRFMKSRIEGLGWLKFGSRSSEDKRPKNNYKRVSNW